MILFLYISVIIWLIDKKKTTGVHFTRIHSFLKAYIENVKKEFLNQPISKGDIRGSGIGEFHCTRYGATWKFVYRRNCLLFLYLTGIEEALLFRGSIIVSTLRKLYFLITKMIFGNVLPWIYICVLIRFYINTTKITTVHPGIKWKRW